MANMQRGNVETVWFKGKIVSIEDATTREDALYKKLQIRKAGEVRTWLWSCFYPEQFNKIAENEWWQIDGQIKASDTDPNFSYYNVRAFVEKVDAPEEDEPLKKNTASPLVQRAAELKPNKQAAYGREVSSQSLSIETQVCVQMATEILVKTIESHRDLDPEEFTQRVGFYVDNLMYIADRIKREHMKHNIPEDEIDISYSDDDLPFSDIEER